MVHSTLSRVQQTQLTSRSCAGKSFAYYSYEYEKCVVFDIWVIIGISHVHIHRSRYVLDNFATVAEAVEGLKTLTTIDERMCNGIVGPDGQTGVHLGAHMVIS